MESKLKMNRANRSSMDDGFSVRVIDAVASELQLSLSAQQVATQLGLSPLDILRLIARGELNATNIEGRYHLDPADVQAAMKSVRRWRVPADVLAVDYNAERKLRERLLKFAKAATPDAAVLAEMQRQVRAGYPLESVTHINLEYRAAPKGLAESLNDPSNSGEFAVQIRGEQPAAPSTVGADYARSRLMANLNRQFEAGMNLVGDKAAYLYSSPARYNAMLTAALERCRTELVSARETRLVEVGRSSVEVGSDLQMTVRRLPVVVNYVVSSESLGLPWQKIARESL